VISFWQGRKAEVSISAIYKGRGESEPEEWEKREEELTEM
jgi:hypothetical protein